MKQGRYEFKNGQPFYVSSRLARSNKEESSIGACIMIVIVILAFLFL